MDLGLNRLTPAEFRAIFENSGSWEDVAIQYNRGDNRLFAVFNALRRGAGRKILHHQHLRCGEKGAVVSSRGTQTR